MARGLRAYATAGAVARAQARETLRGRPGAPRTAPDVAAASDVGGEVRTLSIAELLDKSHSLVSIDAKWLSARTLRAMKSELRQHAARATTSGNFVTYDKAIAAVGSIDFVLHVLARGEGGRR